MCVSSRSLRIRRGTEVIMRQIAVLVAVLALGAAALACASPLAPAARWCRAKPAWPLRCRPSPPRPHRSQRNARRRADRVPDALPHDLFFLQRMARHLADLPPRHGRAHRSAGHLRTVERGRYGVSPVDGSIAFVTNNQLYLVDAAGAGRRCSSMAAQWSTTIAGPTASAAPVWSPDGQTLAYGHGGLNFIDPLTGAVNKGT